MAKKPTYEELEQKHHVGLTPRQMYLLICIVGLMITGILGYGFFKGNRMNSVYAPLIDAVMEIKLEATIAHLWFEEIISGDRHEEIKTVWKHHEQAEWYVQAMLEGGKSPEGTFVPLENAEMRRKIKNIQGQLKEFRKIAQERIEAIETSGIGSDIDQRYDHVFRGFLKEADEVESRLQQIMAKDLNVFRDIQVFLIVISILLFSALGISFWHFNNQRVKNLLLLREANKALRESEVRYRQLVENAVLGIFQVTKGGKFIMVNQRMVNIFGYDSQQDFLANIDNIVKLYANPEKRAEVLQKIDEKGHIEGLTINFIGKNGNAISCNAYGRLCQSDDGEHIYEGLLEDVTDKRHIEAQLQQAQKMEAIGTLAGGIAHDFNNILMPMMIHTELTMEDIPEESPLNFRLEKVLNGSIRARGLVRQILTFSRQTGEERIPLKISPIIKEAMKLLRSSLPTTIKIRQSIEPESGAVLADPTQIHQVLMNLCTNAFHAMREGGGILEVSMGTVEIDVDDESLFPDLSPGPYVKMRVADTGHGMTRSIREQIFDPYFTTKGKSEGTGLGLAVVHGIIKNYGGIVTVESEPGKGTTFEVLLPMIEDVEKRITEIIEPLPRGKERMLFVDDEKELINAIKPMLERLGYKMTSKTNSIEALEAFRENPHGFDLIITDYTMPDMTGADLAKGCLNIRPDIPIILCTGFSDMINQKKAKAMGIKAFVMKPVVTRELAGIIRDVLDENDTLG